MCAITRFFCLPPVGQGRRAWPIADIRQEVPLSVGNGRQDIAELGIERIKGS